MRFCNKKHQELRKTSTFQKASKVTSHAWCNWPMVAHPCHGPNGGTQRVGLPLCMQDACSFGRTYHSFSPRLASADLKKGVVVYATSVWTTCIHSQIGLKEIWANRMFPCRYAIPSSWIVRASSSVLMYDQLMVISERDRLGTTLFAAGVWNSCD